MRLFASVLILAALLAGSACVTEKYVWVDDLPAPALEAPPYHIQIGDNLKVIVWNQGNLSGLERVRPDGNITLPLAGDVYVATLTPVDAGVAIGQKLNGVVVDPRVSVSVSDSKVPSISVVGEVRSQGQIPLRPGDGVLDVIARVGGLSEFANKDRIFVVRRQGEVQRIRFRFRDLLSGNGAGLTFNLQDGDVLDVE